MPSIKPVYLFADSQLLFWKERDEEEAPFLARLRKLLDEDEPGRPLRAAYLGASNGDAPEFYDLFRAAMDGIGIHDTRMVPSRPTSDDLAFFDEADLILFAGGDVRQGWESFEQNGLPQKVFQRYYGGALLIGVSAGAVQLGLKGWEEGRDRLFDTFRVVPFVVDVHDEPSWARLLRAVPRAGEHARGIGIPTGGGAVYHPDHSVEPIRHPMTEVSLAEEGVRQALLFPGEGCEPAGADEAAAEKPWYLEPGGLPEDEPNGDGSGEDPRDEPVH